MFSRFFKKILQFFADSYQLGNKTNVIAGNKMHTNASVLSDRRTFCRMIAVNMTEVTILYTVLQHRIQKHRTLRGVIDRRIVQKNHRSSAKRLRRL